MRFEDASGRERANAVINFDGNIIDMDNNQSMRFEKLILVVNV